MEEHAPSPSPSRAEAREMLLRGGAASQSQQGRKGKEGNVAGAGEGRGGRFPAGHLYVLLLGDQSNRGGGRGGGVTQHVSLPSAHAPLRAVFLAAQPAPLRSSFPSLAPAASPPILSAEPPRSAALSSATVIVPSWSRPRTRLRAKSFLPRKRHEQSIAAPIGRLHHINIRLRRRRAVSLVAEPRLIHHAAYPLATIVRPPSAAVTAQTF